MRRLQEIHPPSLSIDHLSNNSAYGTASELGLSSGKTGSSPHCSFLTRIGVKLSLKLASPSSPALFFPQAHSSPSYEISTVDAKCNKLILPIPLVDVFLKIILSNVIPSRSPICITFIK